MSCNTNIAPLQFTFQNTTLTSDGLSVSNGIALQIGTPSQLFAFAPTFLLNNTYVNNLSSCGSDPNSTCISSIGGGYDPSASSTYVSTTQNGWNGSAESDSDALLGLAALFFNDVLTVNGHALDGFPLMVQTTPFASYAGLGLGSNSTFINRLVEAELAPSNSFSFYTGVYSDYGAGSLIIGGSADRFYTGELYTKNTSDSIAESTIFFDVASIEWTSGGVNTSILPTAEEMGTNTAFRAVVDPYYPSMIVPHDMLWKWGNATNGTWNEGAGLYSYESGLPDGELTVTLQNGLKTTIPASALFNPPSYTNGLFGSDRNGSNLTYSVFTDLAYLGQSYESVTNVGLFGIPYTAYIYLIRDYENSQLSIANANPSARINGDAQTICPVGKKSNKKGSSSNAGAIAGGVVGGVVGLALIAALAWFLWRRKNKKTKAAAATNGTADHELKSELPPDNTAPPTYSASNDDVAKKGVLGQTGPPMQELGAQESIPEAPGTVAPPPAEMPAHQDKVIRSELPA